jgi:hypothetical protein
LHCNFVEEKNLMGMAHVLFERKISKPEGKDNEDNHTKTGDCPLQADPSLESAGPVLSTLR